MNKPCFKTEKDEQAFDEKYGSFTKKITSDFTNLDIDTSFGCTHIIKIKSSSNENVVVLSGKNATLLSWIPCINVLSKKYNIYLIDTIGDLGKSTNNGRAVRNYQDYANWLDQTLSKIGLNSFYLCGHSFGGWIATWYTIFYPNKVKKLILIEPVQTFAGFSIKWMLKCIKPYLFPSEDNINNFFKWEAQGCDLDKEWLQIEVLGMMKFSQIKNEASLIKKKYLQKISIPILVILAGRSVVHDIYKIQKNAEKLELDVMVKIIPDSSHMLIMDFPIKGAELIDTFVSKE